MLEHVGRDRDVVAGADLLGEPLLEVGLDELVDPLLHSGDLEVVDAGHVVAAVTEQLAEQPAGAADVEDL